MFGDNNNGLLQMISETKDSFLASVHVIQMVRKLLDCKKNIYYEAFNKIFGMCTVEIIKQMRLDKHAQYQNDNEDNDNDSYFILDQYINIQNMKGNLYKVDDIIESKSGIDNYESWK